MRAANIVTGVAVLLWIGMFVAGRSLIEGVVAQHVLGYPNLGQIEYYFVFPAFVAMALLLCAWAFNILRRWPWVLALISAGSLLALLPFLFVYSSGV